MGHHKQGFKPIRKDDPRVAVKQVFIGQRPPSDHWAPAAKRFIKAEELYRPRRGG